MKVLVIDDDPGLRKSLNLILVEEGHHVVLAGDGEEGIGRAGTERPDVILCDMRMPKVEGLEFLERYLAQGGEALVIMMTAYGSTELAVEAMRRGAYDYLSKPFGADEVALVLRKAEEREQLRREVGRLREEVRVDRRFGEIVAKSPSMVNALEVATKVAAHDTPVLISGDTGTGKELVARLIHRVSGRGEGPFVPVNCGAIPENLLESEFFGHVKGAFTGAERDRQGLFEAAEGGTLFLDEIGELTQNLQVKLLRALQEGEIRPVGGNRSTKVDARVVSATNRDLDEAIRSEEFRSDLYYRLSVVPIHLPPLRERPEEIPELATLLLERHKARMGVSCDRIDPGAMEALLEYGWPGNVRELENVLERALVLCEGETIARENLPEHVRVPHAGDDGGRDLDDDLSVKRRTAALEKRLIRRALERTGGNKTAAARLLDLSTRALRYKVRDYGLD